MKKKVIIGISVVLLVVLLGIILIYSITKVNNNKEIEAVKDQINYYYNNITINNTDLNKLFIDKTIYEEKLYYYYPFYDLDENNFDVKNKIIDYYNNLDEKTKLKIEISDVIINNNQARALVKLSRSECYKLSNYSSLFTSETDMNDSNFYKELENLTNNCLKNDKNYEEVETITFEKKDNEWFIKDFYSVLDNEINETKLNKQNIVKQKEFSNVYTDTDFRLIDFDLVSNKENLNYNEKFEFSLNSKKKITLKLEIKGNKNKQFYVDIYDGNRNSLLNKKITMKSNYEVIEVPFTLKEKTNMLLIYVYNKNSLKEGIVLNDISFGRIYIYNK